MGAGGETVSSLTHGDRTGSHVGPQCTAEEGSHFEDRGRRVMAMTMRLCARVDHNLPSSAVCCRRLSRRNTNETTTHFATIDAPHGSPHRTSLPSPAHRRVRPTPIFPLGRGEAGQGKGQGRARPQGTRLGARRGAIDSWLSAQTEGLSRRNGTRKNAIGPRQRRPHPRGGTRLALGGKGRQAGRQWQLYTFYSHGHTDDCSQAPAPGLGLDRAVGFQLEYAIISLK